MSPALDRELYSHEPEPVALAVQGRALIPKPIELAAIRAPQVARVGYIEVERWIASSGSASGQETTASCRAALRVRDRGGLSWR